MAYLPNNVRDRYLSYMDFKQYNERTITSREDYLKELEEVLQKDMRWIMRKNCRE